MSPHVRESGIQQIFAFGIRNPPLYFCMESGIQKVGIRNPKGCNPESRCRDPESRRLGSGIQDLRGFSYMGRIVPDILVTELSVSQKCCCFDNRLSIAFFWENWRLFRNFWKGWMGINWYKKIFLRHMVENYGQPLRARRGFSPIAIWLQSLKSF